MDPGFSYSNPGFEHREQNVGSGFAFAFGASDSGERLVNNNNVLDQMRRLKIESDNARIGRNSNSGDAHLSGEDHSLRVVDESVVSELPEDLRRLNIGSDHFSKLYGENMEDLPNKMTKLNVKDSEHNSNSSGGSSDVLLPDRMNNLKIRDSVCIPMNNDKVDDVSSNYLKDNERSSSGVEATQSSAFSFQGGLESKNSGSHGSCENQSNTSLPMFSSSGHSKKVEFCFSSKLDSVEPQHVEFKTPDPKAHTLFGLNRKFDTKRESVKESALKKKKGKSKKPSHVPMMFQHDSVFQENMHESTESSEHCSPMDFSPYEETLASNTCSRETSVASEESSHFDENKDVSNDITDEALISATRGLSIESDLRGQDKESASHVNEGIRAESAEEDAVSGAETESFKSATDELDYSIDTFVTAADTEEVSSGYRIEKQDSDGATRFKYDTGLAVMGQTNFTFAASPSSLSEPSASIGFQKKKSQIKPYDDSFSSPKEGQNDNFNTVSSQRRDKSEQVKELLSRPDCATTATIAAQESCEKWRLRCG